MRQALDGIAALSRSINTRDGQLGELLEHARSVSSIVADRADQLNQLIIDGNSLFAALSARRQQLQTLISGIDEVSRQLSGFVDDNRPQFGYTLQKLNLVLDNLNARQDHIGEALRQLPGYSTQLGEVVGSARIQREHLRSAAHHDRRSDARRLLPTGQVARQQPTSFAGS